MSHEHDHHRLSPEERAMADALARVLPRGGPPQAVDAGVLAAARAALAEPATAPVARRRQRWPATLGIAAFLTLAVGVAWQLRPAPEGDMPALAERSATAGDETAAPRTASTPRASGTGTADPAVPLTTSVPAAPPSTGEQQAAEVEPAPATTSATNPTAAATARERDTTDRGRAAQEAPAGRARTLAKETADLHRTAAQPAPAPRTASTRQQALAAPPPPPAPPAPPAPAVSSEVEAGQAATATHGDVVPEGGDLHGDPPATVDSPAFQRLWLERIRELRDAGELEVARESLREYRRRYPSQSLPDDLDGLLDE